MLYYVLLILDYFILNLKELQRTVLSPIFKFKFENYLCIEKIISYQINEQTEHKTYVLILLHFCRERSEVTLFQIPTFFNGIPNQSKLQLIYFYKSQAGLGWVGLGWEEILYRQIPQRRLGISKRHFTGWKQVA